MATQLDLKKTIRDVVTAAFNGPFSQLLEEIVIYTFNTQDPYDPKTGENILPKEVLVDNHVLPSANIADDSYGYLVAHIDAIRLKSELLEIFMIRNFGDNLFIGFKNEDIKTYRRGLTTIRIGVNGEEYELDIDNLKLVPDEPTSFENAQTTGNPQQPLSFGDWQAVRPWGNINDFRDPVYYYYVDDPNALAVAQELRSGTASTIELYFKDEAYDPKYHNISLHGIFTDIESSVDPAPIRGNRTKVSIPIISNMDTFTAIIPANIDPMRIQCDQKVARIRGEIEYNIKSFSIDPTETVVDLVLEKQG